MTVRSLAVLVVLAVVVGVGALRFPKLLDPGRAEANGIRLNLYADSGTASETNDWSAGQTGVGAKLDGGRLVVQDGPTAGYELVSRPLAVFAHRRYLAIVRIRSLPGGTGTGVGVTDGDLTGYVAMKPVPPARRLRTVSLAFSTGSRHRVSIVLYGQPGSTTVLAAARLAPAP